MTEPELKEEALKLAREGIQDILNGHSNDYETKLLNPREFINLLESFGFIDNEDFETNGWEWDWWQTMEYKDEQYQIGGSGYFGGVSIEKEE